MSQNKRVALTLSPEIDDVLTAISKVTKRPKTVLITELLIDALPVMQQVLVAIKQAQEGKQKLAVETMAKFLGETSQSLNQAHIDFGGIKAKHGAE